MKREEMLAWAKSLKPGDNVILDKSFLSANDNIFVLEVDRVTPAGWVKTTDGETFSLTGWSGYLEARGRRSKWRIKPATSSLLEEASRQEAEREEEKRKQKTIVDAEIALKNEYMKSCKMTYDRAVKILEFFKTLEDESNC